MTRSLIVISYTYVTPFHRCTCGTPPVLQGSPCRATAPSCTASRGGSLNARDPAAATNTSPRVLSVRPAASQELPGYGGDRAPLLGVFLFITGAGTCSPKARQRSLSSQPGLSRVCPMLSAHNATLGPSSPSSCPQAAGRQLGIEGEMKADTQPAVPHGGGQGGRWASQQG